MNYYLHKIEGGTVTSPRGITAAGVSCGIKDESKDMAVLFSETPCTAAGVFTTNLYAAPPVILTRRRLENPVRALVVNSGNANACVGPQGLEDAVQMARHASRCLQVPGEAVLVASTGVIGRPLPMNKIRSGIELACGELSPEGGHLAARAIMTTDTAVKEAAWRVEHKGAEGGSYHLGGMAKGSGMICPDMATMLAFITTDAQVERRLLQKALARAADRSFNLITVDGDTSTNDMALVLAGGSSGVKIEREGPAFDYFCAALQELCRELSYAIVRDGEGATKVIALHIKQAPDLSTARRLARSVLNSLLVKTAFFGEDANWGRIFTAMGCSGASFDPQKVDLYLGPVQVASRGRGAAFSEAEALRVLREREVPVTIDLNMGEEELWTWGSDLSYDYVTINASYRT